MVRWCRTDGRCARRVEEALLAGERRELSAIRHPAARARAVVARGLLRTLVAEVTGITGERLVFDRAPSGQLLVAGHPDVRVSVSHTQGLAAAALSLSGAVGIDAERIDRHDLPRPEAWLSDRERTAEPTSSTPPGVPTDLLRWTAKEAALKATGTGMTVPLRDVVVTIAPHQPADGVPHHGTLRPVTTASGRASWIDPDATALEARLVWYRPTPWHILALAYDLNHIPMHLVP